MSVEWATLGGIECRCGDVFYTVEAFHEHIHLSHPEADREEPRGRRMVNDLYGDPHGPHVHRGRWCPTCLVIAHDIRTYAAHDSTCDYDPPCGSCSCGFDAVLARYDRLSAE